MLGCGTYALVRWVELRGWGEIITVSIVKYVMDNLGLVPPSGFRRTVSAVIVVTGLGLMPHLDDRDPDDGRAGSPYI